LKRRQGNRFRHPLDTVFAKSFPEANHQRRIERAFLRKLFHAEEKMQVRMLLDRFDRLAIGQPKSLFDQQCAKRYASRNNRYPESWRRAA